tara:strand:- start:148 stop:384 length:237 start_codon:yes stop_codon:yes gene_type:complete
MLNEILEKYEDSTFLKADGFDKAVIGLDEKSMNLIYSVKACIKILCKEMSYDESIDFFYFNVKGSDMGKRTPIWCEDI